MRLLLLLLLLPACAEETAGEPRCTVDVGEPVDLPGIGHAQGAELVGDTLWIVGDDGEGVVRSFDARTLEPLAEAVPWPALAHPTGLAVLDDGRAIVGDTVGGVGRFHVFADFPRGEANHVVDDDAAVNGSRPERVGDLIASADYGEEANAVRFYDPVMLGSVTSSLDALVRSFPAPPFVQSIEARGDLLVLAANTSHGEGWRVVVVEAGEAGGGDVFFDADLGRAGELEAVQLLPDGSTLFITSSTEEPNATRGSLQCR